MKKRKSVGNFIAATGEFLGLVLPILFVYRMVGTPVITKTFKDYYAPALVLFAIGGLILAALIFLLN